MSEYYAVQRTGDHLSHYGVKGMKWGVRKAIASGNEKALDRHFRKAAKKLAKLQDIGLNSPKYAAKAAAYGAAAVGTGTLAIRGKLYDSSGTLYQMNGVTHKKIPVKVSEINPTKTKILKAAAAAATAGLVAKSAQNAYRAKNGAKYRKKANDFRNAMDEVFSGTKYEKRYVAKPKVRKKRRASRT